MRRRRLSEQMILFDPPRRLPRWERLPGDVRREVTQLVAKMLRELPARPVARGEGGAAHE